ncbi:cytochrome c oxidase subunit II [bacterium]|nr:MAG: cytochrome c oxidase subunit II [bacterium]
MILANLPFMPEQASTIAHEIDELYVFTVVLSTVVSLLIVAALIWFMVRYKRRSADEIGHRETAGDWLEITWTVIPAIVFLGLFFWGAKVYFDTYRVPEGADRYYVVGKQWMWKFQHPAGNREINELHVPVGRPIELVITSEDVIHSFFVPAFRTKRDAVPGRYSTAWFEATKTGTYDIFCAEYCGAEHSLMIGKITVMEPADYEAWLVDKLPERTLAASGEELFQEKSCNTCHRADSDARAPILNGIYGSEVALLGGARVTADDNYIRESIINPAGKVVAGYQPIMPTYKGQLTEEEILELMSYIQSLESAGHEGEGAEGTM